MKAAEEEALELERELAEWGQLPKKVGAAAAHSICTSSKSEEMTTKTKASTTRSWRDSKAPKSRLVCCSSNFTSDLPLLLLRNLIQVSIPNSRAS